MNVRLRNSDVTRSRVVATVIGTLADARTCFPNIILWQLVLDVIFIWADTENVEDYDHVIVKLISVTNFLNEFLKWKVANATVIGTFLALR